jgi:hypothetical protein
MLGSRKVESHWVRMSFADSRVAESPLKRTTLNGKGKNIPAIVSVQNCSLRSRIRIVASSESGPFPVTLAQRRAHAQWVRGQPLESEADQSARGFPFPVLPPSTMRLPLPVALSTPPWISSAPEQVEESPACWEQKLLWGPGALPRTPRSMRRSP